MSAETAHHGDEHGHHDGASHGSLSGYVTGFVLSVILTAIPFWLVMARPVESALWTGIIIMAFAAVQIVVHMVYFLHMNTKSEGGWTILALIFTVTLVVITLTGSLWVMHHLNSNMMPMSVHDMRHAP
ncbi:cytochrome o ubiquinol oxidase subunit IV [Methylobacterium dankookense]|uniref:Cytochrome bo(3) ubiquinol oxidase subunit 4 n=1 Tax=Methylobacterium dankookense TaxID=560405 RepID=A0A564G5J4_9HYPH|nr:cytochrome o ubiquinol oxidase subunit IV [Methylobacterium dankookense]GJD56508.1 Cytochrome bo(3) ubiquinol oxidase subunit 4 [Methylobacterium dankookense]VUF15304.1 Cytochrome bo(3) ubiquinol oxidase subunit 4 [Methylobacterium dankookense]